MNETCEKRTEQNKGAPTGGEQGQEPWEVGASGEGGCLGALGRLFYRKTWLSSFAYRSLKLQKVKLQSLKGIDAFIVS